MGKTADELHLETHGVVLSGKHYRVRKAGAEGMDLIGPRGGRSTMIRNRANPTLWGHIVMNGRRATSHWYRREPDGTFTSVIALSR